MNSADEVISTFELTKRPLIVCHAKPDGDAITSSLALALFFMRHEKKPVVVIERPLPKNFQFLPGVKLISEKDSFPRELVLQIRCFPDEIDRLRWTKSKDGRGIDVVISPKDGSLEPRQIRATLSGIDFDSIFVLDTSDLKRLGDVYEKNPTLFRDVPTINIDHHPDNTFFAKINLIDPEKSSTAEILAGLFQHLENQIRQKKIDADIATCLLAGIAAETSSFQYENTTPDVLALAAFLLSRGARQQEIVHHLFQSKPLATFRLWGRILEKLHLDSKNKIAWAEISREDYAETGSVPSEKTDLLNGLLIQVHEAEMIILFSEEYTQPEEEGDENGPPKKKREGDTEELPKKPEIRVSIRTKNGNKEASNLAKTFGGGGHVVAAGCTFPGDSETLSSARGKVLSAAEKIQGKRFRDLKIRGKTPQKESASPEKKPVMQNELSSLSQPGLSFPMSPFAQGLFGGQQEEEGVDIKLEKPKKKILGLES